MAETSTALLRLVTTDGFPPKAPSNPETNTLPEVRGPTLMKAIQAIDAKVQNLVAQLDAANPQADDVTDLEDELLGYEKAASELKAAYEAALKMASNLPAYDKLVR